VKEKYNVNSEDLALLKVFRMDEDIDFEIKEGNGKHKREYFDLLEFVENNDMSLDKNLSYVTEKIDVDNFFHYVAYQVYYTNTDSFSNNMSIWKKDTLYNKDHPVGHDGRWRWMLFDLDWGMNYRIHGSLDYDGDINMINHLLDEDRRMSLFRN